jgi:hypothetical protein
MTMRLWAKVRAHLFGDGWPDADAPTVSPTHEPAQPEIKTPAEPAEPVEPTRTEVEAPTGQPTDEPTRPEVEAPAEPAISAAESDPGAVAARQERAAGRILEDERLRGDLTDDEFQPLLDWALAVTDRVAASTASLSDDEADSRIDAVIEALREAVNAAGAAIVAHNEGDTERRASELEFLAHQGIESVLGLIPGLAPGMAAGRLSALADAVSVQDDLGGAEVAARIADALAIDAPDTGAGQ